MIRSRVTRFFVLAGILAFAANVQAASTRVSVNGSQASSPIMKGDLIGFTDHRNGSGDVYVLDRASGVEHHVTSGASEDRLVDMSGSRLLIWSDYDLFVCDLDLATGNCAPQALTSGGFTPAEASLDGDRVVWFDAGDDPSIMDDRFVIQDLASGEKQFYYAPNKTAIGHPQFSGDRIIFEAVKGKNARIQYLDLPTGKVRTLHRGRAERGLPAVAGDLVVWSEGAVDEADIRLYDFAAVKNKDKKRWASLSDGGQLGPRVAGNRMVWEDMRDGQGEIYHCNLTTGIETQVAPSAAGQHQPYVDGDEAVWVEDGALFVAALPEFLPPEVDPNLVLNPGFEDGNGDWTGFSRRKVVTTDAAYNGSSSIRFDLGTGVMVVRQKGLIELDAAAYRIEAAVMTEGVSGVALLEVEWKNAKGKTLRIDSVGHASGDTPWTVIGSESFATPPDAAKAIVRLVTTRGSGSAYFDDVRFERAE